MYLILKHSHSGLRWLILIFLLTTIITAWTKVKLRKEYKPFDKYIASITAMIVHIQFLLGIILYFISGKVVFSAESISNSDLVRFYTLEHITLMTFAVVLITIGQIRAKRTNNNLIKLKRIYIYYLLGLAVILYSIPWPWQILASSLF